MKHTCVLQAVLVCLLAAACGGGDTSAGTGGTTSSSTDSSVGGASSTSSSSSSSTSSSSSSTSSSSSSTSSSSSSSGSAAGSVDAVLADLALYIDCAKTGADQLQGTVFVNFTSTSSATEIVTLTSGSATIHNGSNSMVQELLLTWSAANSQPPGEIPPGGVNGIVYKEQPGAPAPPMTPCMLCPVNNNNVSPTLDVTLTWDHAGETITASKSTATMGCLNQY